MDSTKSQVTTQEEKTKIIKGTKCSTSDFDKSETISLPSMNFGIQFLSDPHGHFIFRYWRDKTDKNIITEANLYLSVSYRNNHALYTHYDTAHLEGGTQVDVTHINSTTNDGIRTECLSLNIPDDYIDEKNKSGFKIRISRPDKGDNFIIQIPPSYLQALLVIRSSPDIVSVEQDKAIKKQWTLKSIAQAIFGIYLLCGAIFWDFKLVSGTLFSHEDNHTTAHPNSTNITTSTENDFDFLEKAALGYIVEWNRKDPLCDEIEMPSLAPIQRGKVVFILLGGGRVDPPIPAIVARINGNCVIHRLRSRKPITDIWIMMARDKSFNQLACINISNSSIIKSFAKDGCTFIPNNEENGLIEQNTSTSIDDSKPSQNEENTSNSSPTTSSQSIDRSFAPSFDCRKSLTTIENTICSDKELSEADARLDYLYKIAISKTDDKQALKMSQIEWRKQDRDTCKDMKCLLLAYQIRENQLK